MKKSLCTLVTLATLSACSISFAAFNYKNEQLPAEQNPWFVSVGGGYAWSNDAGISNPDASFWDPAAQGYDANLGNSPFWSIGIGKQVWDYINVDVSYTDYDTFHYQKYQTSAAGLTPGLTNARTRYFDLDNQSILFNLTFHPRVNQLTFNCDKFSIFPFVSVGIGAGFNGISDFHTVGAVSIVQAAPNTPVSVGSTSSVGEASTETSFAWQGSVGLTVQAIDKYLAVDIGYRYYDGGNFTGPDAIAAFTGSAGQIKAVPVAWEGSLTTNQAFVNFRFLV